MTRRTLDRIRDRLTSARALWRQLTATEEVQAEADRYREAFEASSSRERHWEHQFAACEAERRRLAGQIADARRQLESARSIIAGAAPNPHTTAA